MALGGSLLPNGKAKFAWPKSSTVLKQHSQALVN